MTALLGAVVGHAEHLDANYGRDPAQGLTARRAGASPAQAILTGTGAAGTVMAIFFAAVSAYH